MRKSVSMDNIFHGEVNDKTTHSTTTATKIPPNSDKSRVLYKLPTSARSALTVNEEMTEGTTTDTEYTKHHKSVSTSSVTLASETRLSLESASTRQHHKCTSLDTTASGVSNHNRKELGDTPLSPSKKRTIGRLIEALSTQFRGMSNGSASIEQHINDNNSTWKHNHLMMKSSKGHSAKSSLDASTISLTNSSNDIKVDSKLDVHELTSSSTDSPKSTATISSSSSSSSTVDKIIKQTALPTATSTINSTAETTTSTAKAKPRKSLRVRFDPAAVLLDAARYGDINLMRHCLDAGISPDYQSVHRRMGAIHMAASYDHLDACRLLVDTGADPNLQDAEGWTPLHCAAAEGHLRVVTFLLGHDEVDTTLMNADEETAEDVAEEERVRSVLHASILNAARSS
jgi:hypothetical protein